MLSRDLLRLRSPQQCPFDLCHPYGRVLPFSGTFFSPFRFSSFSFFFFFCLSGGHGVSVPFCRAPFLRRTFLSSQFFPRFGRAAPRITLFIPPLSRFSFFLPGPSGPFVGILSPTKSWFPPRLGCLFPLLTSRRLGYPFSSSVPPGSPLFLFFSVFLTPLLIRFSFPDWFFLEPNRKPLDSFRFIFAWFWFPFFFTLFDISATYKPRPSSGIFAFLNGFWISPSLLPLFLEIPPGGPAITSSAYFRHVYEDSLGVS